MYDNIYNMYYKKIMLISLAYLSIIDSLNGIIINSFDLSITIYYRSILLCFLIFYCIDKKNIKNTKYVNYIFIIGIYAMLVGIINITVYDIGWNRIIKEISSISKIVLIIAMVESYKKFLNRDLEKGKKFIEKIIKYNVILFPLCIIIPSLLNLGNITYHNSNFGNKGFFNATNEVGLIISTLYVFAIDDIYKKGLSIKTVTKALMIICASFMIGSKVGMFMPVIITIIYLIKGITNYKQKEKFVKSISVLIIISSCLIIILFNDMIVDFINRQIYFTKIYSDRGIFTGLSVLLSGRDEILINMHSILMNSKYLIMHLLFGFGIEVKGFLLSSVLNKRYLIEMDFFDAFYSYGIIGIFIIYSYFINTFIKYKAWNDNSFKYTISFINISIMSFISGHVLWGAMAGTFLAIIICGMISSSQSKH